MGWLGDLGELYPLFMIYREIRYGEKGPSPARWGSVVGYRTASWKWLFKSNCENREVSGWQ
jgi:hypothetical protein